MTEKTPVHIVSIKVENFRRISAAELKVLPGKGLVRVTGPTGAARHRCSMPSKEPSVEALRSTRRV